MQSVTTAKRQTVTTNKQKLNSRRYTVQRRRYMRRKFRSGLGSDWEGRVWYSGLQERDGVEIERGGDGFFGVRTAYCYLDASLTAHCRNYGRRMFAEASVIFPVSVSCCTRSRTHSRRQALIWIVQPRASWSWWWNGSGTLGEHCNIWEREDKKA